jgi:hypothetical protein
MGRVCAEGNCSFDGDAVWCSVRDCSTADCLRLLYRTVNCMNCGRINGIRNT